MTQRNPLKLLTMESRQMFWSLQRAARRVLTQALQDGRLPYLTLRNAIKCADCSRRAEWYDIRDYFEPLKAVPVCRGCLKRRGIQVETLKKLGLSKRKIDDIIYLKEKGER